MDHLLEFASFGQRVVKLTSRQGRDIEVTLQGHAIKDIVNGAGINFPFSPGQSWTRTVETWACNNGFKIDGKDPCPEEKIFGIRKKDIPQGHELRMLFPHKFR